MGSSEILRASTGRLNRSFVSCSERGLHRGRVAKPRVSSYLTFPPLHVKRAVSLCCTFPGVAPGGLSSGSVHPTRPFPCLASVYDSAVYTNSQLKCLTERIRFFVLTKPSEARRTGGTLNGTRQSQSEKDGARIKPF